MKNRIIFELIINEKLINLKQIHIELFLSIDYVRVWDYKYIIYINSNFYSMSIRRNKLMLKKRKIMLIRFDSKTTKQYRIYVSNLKRCIKIFIITFFKNVQKDEIDLKLSNFISNELMIRNLKERLKKTLLRFSSIKYEINKIKNISSDFQKLINQIMSLSKSKKSEIIRKKKNILLKEDVA